jgi:Cysteine-rich CPCC
VSLPERGNYLICAVCFWEDDGQDVNELGEESGPNHGITLRQGRANFKAFGACELGLVKHVIRADQRQQYSLIQRELS